MNRTNYLKYLGFSLIIIIAINVISSRVYQRFDLTSDKRFTISESTEQLLNTIDSPLIIDLFLEGDLPSEFRRLRSETKQLLEEFRLTNPLIKVNYIDVLADEETKDRNIEELTKSGLKPYVNSKASNSKVSKELIFPWAFASFGDNNITKIPLLKDDISSSLQEKVSNSIQNLEYAFADAFRKITQNKTKQIAVLKGNGQLNDIYIADFLNTLSDYYRIAKFTLDSVATNPKKTLKQLSEYDLIISAKPTQAFSEEEKFVLDQYTIRGGKSLWLTESVIIEEDSLKNASGSNIAVLKDLNLNDFFFKYGVRINPVIVNDMYSAPIWLALGEGSKAQFQPLRWPYSPLAKSETNHPISKNINLVRFDFASQIDTLKNNIDKTILLQSSKLSKLQGVPTSISLDLVTQEPDPSTFNKGPQHLAVLLEGSFTSVYKNRIKPFQLSDAKDNGIASKMIIISDGNVIQNGVLRNQPQELGFDKWTGKTLGNKEFLLNAVNYLLDDNGLMNIRSKDIAIAFLDEQRSVDERTKWQFINLLLPIVLLALFAFGFNYLRRRQYS
ncbi:gliding motility-associated ABC transporter substrate-binding protein GldG [Ichthyenterobacterium sp. W332]|uniref:Gliding motility-associated ABC transporter substrate-binding protein GldG n=1 Tax=Microcosmobacter mediterraneus TaxID=3075607 RepID=A0ABU2YGV4_9FLAO|nr:gliding motility-associated ABC transporter substrate-binding protein GldG [Ichthyenterobacterium sp. W332]MDT0557408.1 gliding motility-associated ABC transporter substrate-binding protein GldG [Ichthyenterobacterium sp. W332]